MAQLSWETMPKALGEISGFSTSRDSKVCSGTKRDRSVSHGNETPTHANSTDTKPEFKDRDELESEGAQADVEPNSKDEKNTRTRKKAMPIQCHICGKSLSSQGALYKHLLVLHNKLRLYMCEICGKSFGQNGDLKRHYYTHTGEKLFKCDVCGKLLSKASSLKLHMRTHSGERPYHCEVCSKTFAILSDLKRHVLIHSGEKLFNCKFCKRSFGRKEHLAAHYLTHSKESGRLQCFGCEFCSETLQDKNSLRKHYMKHINKSSDAEKAETVNIPEINRIENPADTNLAIGNETTFSNTPEVGITSTLRNILTGSYNEISDHFEKALSEKKLSNDGNPPAQILRSCYTDSEKTSKQWPGELAGVHPDNFNQLTHTSFSQDWKFNFSCSDGSVYTSGLTFPNKDDTSKTNYADFLGNPVVDSVSFSPQNNQQNLANPTEIDITPSIPKFLPQLPNEISTYQCESNNAPELNNTENLYSNFGADPPMQYNTSRDPSKSELFVNEQVENTANSLDAEPIEEKVDESPIDNNDNSCDGDSDNETVNYCLSDKNDDSSSDTAENSEQSRVKRKERITSQSRKLDTVKTKSRSRKGKPKKYIKDGEKVKGKIKKSPEGVSRKSEKIGGDGTVSDNDNMSGEDISGAEDVKHDGTRRLSKVRRDKKWNKTRCRDKKQTQKSGRKKREPFFVQCEVCGLAFTSLAKFRLHERTHTGLKPHQCHLCDKSYASKGDLKLHIEIHSGERRHICEICGNSYLWAKSLKVHRQTHADERPHKCDLCNKAFYLKADLARHCRSHMGIKPYACDQCNRSFTRKEHLIQHSYTHMQVKPNVCDKCHKTFSQKVSLQKHLAHCQVSCVPKLLSDEIQVPCPTPGFSTIDTNVLGPGLIMNSLCQ